MEKKISEDIVDMDTYIENMLDTIANENSNVGDEILAQGYPIVYWEKDTPEGHVLKEYPNGRIELIKVDILGNNDEVVKVIKNEK